MHTEGRGVRFPLSPQSYERKPTMEFHKIDTLFERGAKSEGYKVIEGKLVHPEFDLIKTWHVTEKINGTNTRVTLTKEGKVIMGGKTDDASIPMPLLAHLNDRFTPEKMKQACWGDGEPCLAVVYGEGYGPKVQKGGGNYRPDTSFRIFDVIIEGKDEAGDPKIWWLKWEDVLDIAKKLGAHTVPSLGVMDIPEIVSLVKGGMDSPTAKVDSDNRNHPMEGIVARSPFFTRAGDRAMFKLKTKDFA